MAALMWQPRPQAPRFHHQDRVTNDQQANSYGRLPIISGYKCFFYGILHVISGVISIWLVVLTILKNISQWEKIITPYIMESK